MWWLPLALLWASPAERQLEKTTWTTAEGLPQSSVTAIDQATDGTLLVGTYGGLVQFDGRTFRVADAKGSAGWSGLRVTALATEGRQFFVVGTQDGRVVRSSDTGFETVQTPAALRGQPIWSLSVDGDRVLAVGGGGVASYDGIDWTLLDVPSGQTVGDIDDDTLWLGGAQGLHRVRGDEVTEVGTEIGTVWALCRSDDGLIAGGDTGVVRVEANTVTRLDDEPASELLCANDGSVWAANGTIVRLVGGTTRVDLGDHVGSLFEDREKNLWAGTDGQGLTRLTPEEWRVAEVPGGVLAMVEEAPNRLLVAAYCGEGGLYRHTIGGRFERVLDHCVRAIETDAQGTLLGVDDGVYRWENDELELIVDVGHWVLALLARDDGLWIATEGAGVQHWHDGRLEAVDVGDRRVLSIAEGSDGALWFGTHEGVTRLQGGTTTRWTQDDGVPPGPIRDLLVEDDLVLMASYGGGLGVLRDDEFWRLTAADGLAGNTLSAVLDDGRGALWLNGNRGLNRIDRTALEQWIDGAPEPPRVRRWHSPEGNGGGQPASALLSSGTLAFPTIEGVLFLSPSDIVRNLVQPTVVLRSADVDGLRLDPSRRITVPPGPGRVHIEFTAATLRHPELATLEYRIRHDDDPPGPWRVVHDGEVMWGGVRPGSHVIALRAMNEDGAPSEVMELAFELQPQLHQRLSFWLGVAGFLLAGGVAAHWWRTRAIAEKNRELEREVRQRIEAEEERERISKRLSVAERMEAVGRLAGGVAHDFNNLLTAVAGATSVLRDGVDEDSRASRQSLDNLERCVERGAGLTRRLLAFARQQPMERRTIDAGRQLTALRPLLATTIRDDIELSVELQSPRVGIDVDPSLFDLSIVNLVLNSTDAMPSGGCITVRLERLDRDALTHRFPTSAAEAEHDWVVVSVQDDGRGMSRETLAKARDPFFTTRAHGNGLGLPSVDGFVAQSGGEMHIVSTLGEGTTVSLVLPHVDPPAPHSKQATGPHLTTAGAGRVLLCDDDDLVRESLVRVLQRSGYTTHAFSNPEVLLEQFEPGRFDILVTDVLMPGLSGDELARHLRAQQPDLPVVFISGYTDDVRPDALPGRLLSKPFRSREVVELIAEVLETPAEA